MNCLVSNCKTYHVISDKTAVTINSTIQNWAPSNWENLAKRSIYNYAIFVHSACRLVFIELTQQYQEMNLAQMTRTYEIMLKKRQLSCKGIARDLRIYGLLIVVFVFWFIFSTVVEVFRYFWDRNIPWAKSPPISGRTSDLIRKIFGKFCVFPVNHFSENWITAKRRIFFINILLALSFTVFT